MLKHKFLDTYPLRGKKTVIIGKFNPDVACNKAEFFYGRVQNHFWSLDKSVENIKKEIYNIKEYCEQNSIKFRFLPTPAHFYNKEKL